MFFGSLRVAFRALIIRKIRRARLGHVNPLPRYSDRDERWPELDDPGPRRQRQGIAINRGGISTVPGAFGDLLGLWPVPFKFHTHLLLSGDVGNKITWSKIFSGRNARCRNGNTRIRVGSIFVGQSLTGNPTHRKAMHRPESRPLHHERSTTLYDCVRVAPRRFL